MTNDETTLALLVLWVAVVVALVVVQEQDISNHITIADGVEGCKVCEYEIEPFDLFINDKETRTLTYYPEYRPKNCPECGRRLGEEAQDDQTGSP
jgi:hypothetical protein